MPVLNDFAFTRYDDGILTMPMVPPVAVGGWNVQFKVQHRFGGISGLIVKSMASGFSGVSGITVTNSGNGVFNIALNSADTSGMEYGNYSFAVERLDSGSRTLLSEGYLILLPGVG